MSCRPVFKKQARRDAYGTSRHWVRVVSALLMTAGGALAGGAGGSSDWTVYGADKAGTKFAPLGQIHAGNVAGLEVAWRWTSPDQAVLAEHEELRTWIHESTPLAVGGVLYTATSLSQVAAVDPGTGETLWVHDPGTWKRGSPPNMGFLHRGVAWWEGEGGRIFHGTGDGYLLALDPATGEPVAGFGEAGRVDLTEGLRRPVDRDLYGVTSPPIVCAGVVVVGSSISDDPLRPGMPPGDVRGFDPGTGALRWTFHTIPQDGPERATWEGGSWRRAGNANVWTLMSCDEELGYVYLPVSTPTNDYYGGGRLGDNLFADSLVALDAATGERVWHFQTVHHGLWDYDLPAAPNLVDLTIGGERVRAVAQVSKQAFTYVLDRVTGKPVWPIDERPVPESEVDGERASPTQPFPRRPPPFDRQGVAAGDLIDFTPELRAEALEILAGYDHGPLYTPPSEVPALVLPGPVGGASWAGAAVDPRRGRLYVPSVTKASLLALVEPGDEAPGHAFRGYLRLDPPGPRGLPLWKPPYGRVTALDLDAGEIAWTRAIGDGPRDHPALAGLDLPPLGWPRRSFVLLTESLLFVAQQGEWRLDGMNARGNAVLIDNRDREPYLLALDPEDGRVLAEVPLPGNATGSPMTYLHRGRQYVVLPIGGGLLPAELVALRLPEGAPAEPSGSGVAPAERWPSFRGPNASGVAAGAPPPPTWDVASSGNVAWKVAVPGAGDSSPIVWGGQVFLTTMDGVEDAEAGRGPAAFLLLSYDAGDGSLRWRRTAVEERLRIGRHSEGSHVNATPATDGERVVAVLGASTLVAYDLGGRRLWSRDLGLLDHGMAGSREIQWGHGSSPILHGGRVFVQVDRHEDSFLAAYDAATGEELWKSGRDELPSWSTPSIYEGPDAVEVVTVSPRFARGHDAATGDERWRLAIGREVTIPAPVVAGDLIYLSGGYPRGQPVRALRAGARGEVSRSREAASGGDLAFETGRGGPYVPTPLVYGGRLYVVSDAGIVSIHDAATGERLDRRRTGLRFTASPVAAGGRLYLAGEDGEVLVAAAGDTFEVLATNGLGEPVRATPAIAGETLYVRTRRHLIAIRDLARDEASRR